MRWDFEGGVYWDELAEICGEISRAAGFRAIFVSLCYIRIRYHRVGYLSWWVHDYCRWKRENKTESDDEKKSKLVEGKNKVVSYLRKKRQTLKHPLRIMVALNNIIHLYKMGLYYYTHSGWEQTHRATQAPTRIQPYWPQVEIWDGYGLLLHFTVFLPAVCSPSHNICS